MAKNEEENTGYITQSTRHSMLVSLSREINVISDENAVLYDTIIELCKKFFPEKNNQKFCAQCKIMEKGAYAPNPIDDPTTPYIESHILRLEMLATGNMELKDQIVKMCRLLLEEKDNDKGNDRSKTLFTIFDTPENAPKLWNRRTYCYQAERAVQDMTAEKAIEVLNKIGEETNIEDTLKNLSNSNIFTALKLAVHALEKQVAKKLKEVIRTSSNTMHWDGSNHTCSILPKQYLFHCGQTVVRRMVPTHLHHDDGRAHDRHDDAHTTNRNYDLKPKSDSSPYNSP